MTKLEMYGIIGAVLLAAIAAAYLKGRADERAILTGQAAAQVLAATQKTDSINEQLLQSTAAHAQQLAQLGQDHAAQLAAALAAVKPVIVRVPAADRGAVPASAAATRAAGAGGQPDVPLPTGVDIATAELMQAGECQADRDALDTYVVFYADVLSRINARKP